MRLKILPLLVTAISCAFPLAAAPIKFTGVNLAGAEFGVVGGALPGTYNTQYTYPTQSEVTYFRSKGMNLVRLCFRWERLQRSTNAPFDATELSTFHTFVSQTTAKGIYVIINPHNFARYYPDITDFNTMQSGSVGVIGSSGLPNSVFADFWSRIAAIYKTNNLVIFGLMNEPNALPATQWVNAANAAIAAIRATGATNLIFVPGISWTGAHSWVSSGNATAMLNIVDSGNNYAFEVHQYLDSDSSGGSSQVVNTNTGVSRITGFTQWLKNNNRKGFLGEFAAANSMMGTDPSQIGDEAINDMLTYIEANADVWLGWSWWAAGPWWGGYMFTLEPSGGDQPAMDVLQLHIPFTAPSLQLLSGNKFKFTAQPGFIYQSQISTNLSAWSNSGSALTGNGQFVTNTMTVGTGARGYYRVRVTRAP